MNRRALLPAGLVATLCGARLFAEPSGLAEVPFQAVDNPPPIQMHLVPGFTVRELPLDLNNINCFAYAPDGRLFALGYDGNVFQLKDTDGDGLEDKADYFYKNDTNEIPASIGMCWGPGGLYIASQKRIIRLKDKGHGTGEVETVTSGWVSTNRGAAGSGTGRHRADSWMQTGKYLLRPRHVTTGSNAYRLGQNKRTIFI